eukprot:CAMPEP_0175064952 /NCGR_PEP_ID=MMETSP0052_2-20121109/15635_1 /TAXON_ID=51329 ORGANISM="Polytomella parva, Strain SAG 63-3" /NCGR_SAMPLE_ID=MMETSP0052_2 /ASSEMBLY_ACC=CAM_ASM_000194 /LENGTH=144 /DNA_ID=CAMNT_0016331393 /DNA_START=480 /DNA_END=911 /DNA_ORIENTATION=-
MSAVSAEGVEGGGAEVEEGVEEDADGSEEREEDEDDDKEEDEDRWGNLEAKRRSGEGWSSDCRSSLDKPTVALLHVELESEVEDAERHVDDTTITPLSLATTLLGVLYGFILRFSLSSVLSPLLPTSLSPLLPISRSPSTATPP